MSDQSTSSSTERERTELPIERGFPIERVNEIADKEGRAKQWYRPVYTMHKWWARRLGCVFRTISLYTLLDDSKKVKVTEPGKNTESLSDWGDKDLSTDISPILNRVDASDPESLWELYPKDVRVEDKKILDPFMGGGTSLVEASRFGAEVVGNDLNPVAWFITKKELEAGQTPVEKVVAAFEQVREDVADEITRYYKTSCPNGDHDADVMYYQWVKELNCTSCDNTVPLFNDYRVGKARYEDGKYDVLCPGCETVIRVDEWQSECHCGECGNHFTPKEGNVSRGNYTCTDCGQKYGIVDAIDEQDGFELRLYAIEYYCPTCKKEGKPKGDVKGYKAAKKRDQSLYKEASEELNNRPDLEDYIPETEIPIGIMTDSSAYEGGIGGGHNLLRHGYEDWRDLYNDRQLLCLSKLLKSIDNLENQQTKELLLLAFSDSLSYSTMLTHYQYSRNHIDHIFSTNSFDAPQEPTENNVWGAEQGAGSFSAMFDMVRRGVEYARSPTERYIVDGETIETPEFETSIGQNATVTQGDARNLDYDSEFDAVLTDPPYYDNVIYSEISNYYYAWLRLSLGDTYEEFEPEQTPGSESIVANPAQGKGPEEFESDLKQSFETIHTALKENGVLAFTYHHSDSESWGELLSALCDVDFEITAAYPVNADLAKHETKIAKGDSVSFDIIVVARPIENRQSISWNQLRRNIYRTARQVRRRLEQSDRELSRGDIGVIEMGRCFHEYSKHHGKVQRDGEIMSAKEVVKEIYGIIQEASDIGVEDVFIDLLNSNDPSFDDVNKLCRGTNASSEDLKEMRLYNQDDGFELGTWDNEKRQAYIQERTNGDSDDHLSNLDKLQLLRYRYEKGQAVQNYVDKWGVEDDLRELAGRLADVTGDETYTRVLGDRDITSY